MEELVCTDKAEWDAYVFGAHGQAGAEFTHFHQTWEWGQFEESRGEKVLRIFVEGTDGAKLGAQVIVHSLPFGFAYAWIPRLNFHDASAEAAIVDFLCARHKIIFCLFEFGIERPVSLAAGARPRLPEQTLILDLRKTEAELMAEMKSKWRYNINLAARRGVKVEILENPGVEDIKIFCDLLRKTSERDSFDPVPESHIQNLAKFFNSGAGATRIFLARATLGGRVVSANLCLGAGNVFTYLHGASDYDARQDMAPHMLQWECIKFARSHGFKFYDFWGVALPPNPKAVKWAGITRFKLGFGGRVVGYMPAQAIPVRKFLNLIYKCVRG